MYYIYELWDKENNQPIYVGYGKGSPNGKYRRYEKHLKEAVAVAEGRISDTSKINMYKVNVLLQCSDIEYKFPYSNLTYQEACDKEKDVIAKYGRRIDGTGPLTNLDSGGRGGMSRSEETCKKISKALKGKPSSLKGSKIGPYSRERVESTSNAVRSAFNGERKKEIRKKISESQKGKTLSEEHKEKISKTLKGRPSPMKGKSAWNKGITKETDDRLRVLGEKVSKSCKGREPWNKGKSLGTKGKTYEEIYGPEMALKMKERRKNTAWINNGKENKKINIEDLENYSNEGWTRGRIMPRHRK